MNAPTYRVLVVDDDPVSRLVLSRILGRLGHDVQGADTVARGLQEALEMHPDVVFSDFMLPDGTGDDLLAAIRQAGSDTPVVLVTGVAELDTSRGNQPVEAAKGDRPAVAATLTKPVDSRAVLQCLQTVLTPARSR